MVALTTDTLPLDGKEPPDDGIIVNSDAPHLTGDDNEQDVRLVSTEGSASLSTLRGDGTPVEKGMVTFFVLLQSNNEVKSLSFYVPDVPFTGGIVNPETVLQQVAGSLFGSLSAFAKQYSPNNAHKEQLTKFRDALSISMESIGDGDENITFSFQSPYHGRPLSLHAFLHACTTS